MTSLILKKCSKCGEEKPVDKFFKNSSKKDKLSTYCKICFSIKNEIYRKNNAEKLAEAAKKWKGKNIEKVLQQQKKWKKNNPLSHSKTTQKWRQNNVNNSRIIDLKSKFYKKFRVHATDEMLEQIFKLSEYENNQDSQ